MKNLFMSRHAYFNQETKELDEFGKKQALRLGKTIYDIIGHTKPVIFSSTAPRAQQTAQGIVEILQDANIHMRNHLWDANDSRIKGELLGLTNDLTPFHETDKDVIVIGHQPLVRYRPRVIVEYYMDGNPLEEPYGFDLSYTGTVHFDFEKNTIDTFYPKKIKHLS